MRSVFVSVVKVKPWGSALGSAVVVEASGYVVVLEISLLVYLRLLDVPLPSIYGPSADENPFVV